MPTLAGGILFMRCFYTQSYYLTNVACYPYLSAPLFLLITTPILIDYGAYSY